jgi:hypothetical protein
MYRLLIFASMKTKIIVDSNDIIDKCQVATCALCLFYFQHIFIYFLFEKLLGLLITLYKSIEYTNIL